MKFHVFACDFSAISLRFTFRFTIRFIARKGQKHVSRDLLFGVFFCGGKGLQQ
jgi:hypothetical protein